MLVEFCDNYINGIISGWKLQNIISRQLHYVNEITCYVYEFILYYFMLTE